MLAQLFRQSSKYCSLSLTLLPRNYSQTIVSSQSSLTRASNFARDARLFSVPAIRVSNLSSNACKQNGSILTKGNPNDFAFFRRTAYIHSVDIKTDVVNNVFLFKYEKPNFFKFMNAFGCIHLSFWLGVSYIMYKYLPSYDSNEATLLKYAMDNFMGCALVVLAALLGTGASFVIWGFTVRSVKYLILNKGGKDATFVMYHPFKKNINLTVPIDTIKCKTARNQMRNYLPLKLTGRPFYYILDSNGEFVNPTLFDNTVGARR